MLFKAFVLPAVATLALAGYTTAQGQGAQVPSGISDLLAATPTMLSPLDLRGKTTKAAQSAGNTVTISGSQIVFAQSDRPTLVAIVTSLIQNSEPSVVGDKLLTNTILAVLDAHGSDAVIKQVQDAIECRARKETLSECVATLVDSVAATEPEDGGDHA